MPRSVALDIDAPANAVDASRTHDALSADGDTGSDAVIDTRQTLRLTESELGIARREQLDREEADEREQIITEPKRPAFNSDGPTLRQVAPPKGKPKVER